MMYVWVYLQDETPDDTLIVVLKEPKTVTNIRLYENLWRRNQLHCKKLSIDYTWMYMEWKYLRGSQKKSKKRAAHGGKVQRLKFSLRILHNELTVAVYLYCRDLLLFQFLRITENCKMADVSVQRNGTKLCSSNAQCIPREENFRTYFPRQN